MTHPNRGPKGPFSNPDPVEVRAYRIAAGYTQTEAARLVYSTLNAWQRWESGDRRMHPAFWALFKLRARRPL